MTVDVRACPHPDDCKLELDYGTGVSECNKCGLIGWLSTNGELYNDPYVRPEIREREKK